jgi:hypothetical protein
MNEDGTFHLARYCLVGSEIGVNGVVNTSGAPALSTPGTRCDPRRSLRSRLRFLLHRESGALPSSRRLRRRERPGSSRVRPLPVPPESGLPAGRRLTKHGLLSLNYD